jgi:hypothetical protein
MDWEWDWNTVTDPLKDMLTVIGEYLPRIVAAIVVLLIALLLAKILKAVVCRILRTARVDDRVNSWLDRDKINRLTITDTIGKLVFWLVLLISIPAVIGVLGLEGVEEPFRNMADSILSAVPAILGAIAVLLIGYFLARLAYAFISSFLKKVGFDNILVKLEISKEAPTGEWTPSRVAGYIAFLVIMLISIIAAADLFNFDSVENLVTDLTAFVGKVILGIVIIAVGVFLAHIAGKAIVATKRQQADLLAILARVAILLLAGAMGFQAMGFANDVITLGFGLILGAVAVAVAIAFGVGGRESAARQLEKWIKTSETKTE